MAWKIDLPGAQKHTYIQKRSRGSRAGKDSAGWPEHCMRSACEHCCRKKCSWIKSDHIQRSRRRGIHKVAIVNAGAAFACGDSVAFGRGRSSGCYS